MRVPYSLTLALGALAVALLATPLVIRLARRAGAFDQPGPRRIHAEPVPTMGGFALAIAVLGVAWLARAFPGPAQLLEIRPLLGLTLASVPILAMGAVDDLRGARPWVKLAIQTCAALTLVLFGYGVPLITNPFGGSLPSGILNLPLTVLWVLVVINAINLIDGLDGLASGAVLIASMSLWWVARSHGDFYVMFISSLVAGSTLGFLRYNFPPARVFMGDTGSNFLGLVLAATSLLDNRKGTATVTLLFPLVAMGLPIADSILAFVRRASRGTPVFRPDSEHIHHRLLRLGLSPRNALFVLWYLCLYLGVMAVVLAALPRPYAWMMLGLLALGLVFAFEVLEFIDKKLSERQQDPPRS
jgi:UDP-GlcNAc:undecaprenyl-phosphate/decaprenyl-phosphate GlcNAc-1-phosphate transferase